MGVVGSGKGAGGGGGEAEEARRGQGMGRATRPPNKHDGLAGCGRRGGKCTNDRYDLTGLCTREDGSSEPIHLLNTCLQPLGSHQKFLLSLKLRPLRLPTCMASLKRHCITVSKLRHILLIQNQEPCYFECISCASHFDSCKVTIPLESLWAVSVG